MLFMKEMRSKVVDECTLKESAAINQILGRKVGITGHLIFDYRYSVTMTTFPNYHRHVVGIIVQCKRDKIARVLPCLLTAALGTTELTQKHTSSINYTVSGKK